MSRPVEAPVPRVSVITTFYNAETHFREAIDSVLTQDFEDFELLLVDDGSTDSSSAIARDYAATDSRIRYLEHPGHANLGISAARNLGIAQANGNLIAFIDADDRWRPAKLREQVELLDRMPYVDAVGGSVVYWNSHSGGSDQIIPTGHARGRPIPPGEATTNFYPLGRANAPSMSDLMFRRSHVTAVGGFETSFRGAYEDQAFLAKFYLNSTLYIIDTIWSDYRLHEASCMARAFEDGSYAGVRHGFLKWFEGYLGASPFRDDLKIRRALDRALQRSSASGKGAVDVRRAIRSVAPGFVVEAVRSLRAVRDRLRPLITPGPVILMYHRIADEACDPWGLAVAPEKFAQQAEWLARNRTVLPLPDFAALHQRGQLPRNAVALTFDDGYACNGSVAVPILEALRIPATIFISPTLIERGRELWWDELARIVTAAETVTLTLGKAEIPAGDRDPADGEWTFGQPPRTKRQHAYHRLWSLLYTMPPYDIEARMNGLREQAGVAPTPRDSHRLLTAQEIKALRSAVIDFGSHALTHPRLPLLTAEDKAREIALSRQGCAELTGTECRSFAYPYGNWDVASKSLVAEAGFDCACKADGGFVRRSSDPFALPRIQVGNWGFRELAQRIGRA